MKKITKRIFSAILSAIMLILALPLTGFATSKTSVGEYETVKFGSYPQSQVKDLTLISKLNSVNKNWISYHYYTGENTYGTMKPGNWMKYADFKYDGNKYRAVTFSQYRPNSIIDESSETNSYQDDNGYYINNIYYFLYEPIKWRVYECRDGHTELVSEMILDSQPFSNVIYKLFHHPEEQVDPYYVTNLGTDHASADNYEASTLLNWLNNDFYYTAFDATQQSKITDINLMDYLSSGIQLDDTYEYFDIYVPGIAFQKEKERRGVGTDYAKCQGLYVDTKQFNPDGLPYSPWWLKNHPYNDYDNGSLSGAVPSDREANFEPEDMLVTNTSVGIRPVIRREDMPLREKGVTYIEAKSPVYYGETAKLYITVNDSPTKIRIVDTNNNSLTLERNNPAVTDIVQYSAYTEVWSVDLKVKHQSMRYSVYAKYARNGWYNEPYHFTLTAQERVPDKDVYSFSIDECYDDVMYAGVHKITVETGVDATKVQFYKDGNTWTYSADNASYVIEDDKKIWSINMNFSELGEDMEYYIRTRSQKSAFEFTDQVMNVWVRFK